MKPRLEQADICSRRRTRPGGSAASAGRPGEGDAGAQARWYKFPPVLPTPVSTTWTSSSVVVRRDGVRRVLAWLCFGVGLACVVVAVLPSAAVLGALSLGWTVLPPLALLLAWVFLARTTLGACELQVSGEVFAVSGKRRSVTVRRDAIRGGVIVPYDDRCEVAFALADGRTISAAADGVGAAESILAALGIDAARQRSRVVLSL